MQLGTFIGSFEMQEQLVFPSVEVPGSGSMSLDDCESFPEPLKKTAGVTRSTKKR
jgi:hypothetical protein